MEVLNKNQRRSAMWRVVAISVFILALIATGMLAMHQSYTGQGYDEITELKKKHERDLSESKKEIRELNNKITELKNRPGRENEIDDLKDQVKYLKGEHKNLKLELKNTELKLDRCRTLQNG